MHHMDMEDFIKMFLDWEEGEKVFRLGQIYPLTEKYADYILDTVYDQLSTDCIQAISKRERLSSAFREKHADKLNRNLGK